MLNKSQTNQRLKRLEKHLKEENPVLSKVVASFRELDRISRKLGFFNHEESHATRTAWWPLISVLGVYSAGKSTFINHYLSKPLQATGTQAVDDKYTVLCYTEEDTPRVLPGLALDADPRFPLYKISHAIEEVAEGEGRRIDAYLQLKTCRSEKLRGKIFIDSPGFDADAQRTSTLRITHHIIDLSDLVLVFFDARHPETGSMHDTLEHLVKGTIHRHDSNKFLYILNQIDTTSREDNPEEVFSAWQRALAYCGLTAGRYYSIYNEEAAIPIEDEKIRLRFQTKRDIDLKEIFSRIEEVGVERAYRIVGMLEETARMLEQDVVPKIQGYVRDWRRKVLQMDGMILGLILLAFLALTIWRGYWDGLSLKWPLLDHILGNQTTKTGLIVVFLIIGIGGHHLIRRWTAKRLTRKVLAVIKDKDLHDNFTRSFRLNTLWYRSLFNYHAIGWGRRTKKRLEKVVDGANVYIQKLNDMYTNPSGDDVEKREIGDEPVDDAQEGHLKGDDPDFLKVDDALDPER